MLIIVAPRLLVVQAAAADMHISECASKAADAPAEAGLLHRCEPSEFGTVDGPSEMLLAHSMAHQRDDDLLDSTHALLPQWDCLPVIESVDFLEVPNPGTFCTPPFSVCQSSIRALQSICPFMHVPPPGTPTHCQCH